jgi:hypothetical protein
VDVALVVVAFLAAALLLGRGFRGDRLATDPVAAGEPFVMPAARTLPPGLSLATVIAGEPRLRIFASRPTEISRGLPPPDNDYTLTVVRGAEGRWSSVLRAPPVVSAGGALTVTLIVPWQELAARYSTLNLVVR